MSEVVIRATIGEEEYAFDHDNTIFHSFSPDYEHMNYLRHQYTVHDIGRRAIKQLIVFGEPDLFETLRDTEYPELIRLVPTNQDTALYNRYLELNTERELDNWEERFKELENGA